MLDMTKSDLAFWFFSVTSGLHCFANPLYIHLWRCLLITDFDNKNPVVLHFSCLPWSPRYLDPAETFLTMLIIWPFLRFFSDKFIYFLSLMTASLNYTDFSLGMMTMKSYKSQFQQLILCLLSLCWNHTITLLLPWNCFSVNYQTNFEKIDVYENGYNS